MKSKQIIYSFTRRNLTITTQLTNSSLSSLISEYRKQMVFKVGDLVKITDECLKAAKDVYADFVGLTGKVCKIDKIYNFYKVEIGAHPGIWFGDTDIELVNQLTIDECVCDGWTLLNKGCSCGSVNNG